METIVKEWLGSPVKATATATESEPFASAYDETRDGFLITHLGVSGILRVDCESGEVAAGTQWYQIGPGQTLFVGRWDNLYISTNSGSIAYKAQQVNV